MSNVTQLHPSTHYNAASSRAKSDDALAASLGFSLKPPMYSLGTSVQTASDAKAARASQMEHKSKPMAKAMCSAFASRIVEERRYDIKDMTTGELKMDATGKLVLPGEQPSDKMRLPLSSLAFSKLMGRYSCASGAAYLSDCPALLRAKNFNHWSNEEPDHEVVLRARVMNNEQEIFSVVSPTYAPCDANVVAESLAHSFEEDARGSLDYDGRRYRIEGLWQTDVASNKYTSGEVFKAGVIVRSDDTGGGSIHVQSVIHRAVCLNMLILDKATGVDVRIRHVGDPRRLVEEFKKAFAKAASNIQPFLEKWNYAIDNRLHASLEDTFNGVLNRGLVKLPGKNATLVPMLVAMHDADENAKAVGKCNASIINAFTRYAHKVETNPFRADDIREQAGRLLSLNQLPTEAFAA